MAGSIRLVQAAQPVSVNGVTIPRADIAREAQHHPAANAAAALDEAARSLVIRELLLQEARRLDLQPAPQTDAEGRCETDEEALIRGLVEQEVKTPEPDIATCQRYYDSNRARFMSADLYEAAHILIAARQDDAAAFTQARATADDLLRVLRDRPDTFADLAKLHSSCPSAAQGGSLGQISAGQTTPEFELALKAMEPGTISAAPVATRYGLHIIRLERRIAGAQVPFAAVQEQIADYLKDTVEQRAMAQYIGILAGRAQIAGVALNAATTPLVQ